MCVCVREHIVTPSQQHTAHIHTEAVSFKQESNKQLYYITYTVGVVITLHIKAVA